MKKIFARLMKDESGATAIEYGLIAALISVALIGGATALGDKLNTAVYGTSIALKMSTARHAAFLSVLQACRRTYTGEPLPVGGSFVSDGNWFDVSRNSTKPLPHRCHDEEKSS